MLKKSSLVEFEEEGSKLLQGREIYRLKGWKSYEGHTQRTPTPLVNGVLSTEFCRL